MNMNSLQALAVDWGIRCFGTAHILHRGVRAIRCAEEAIELAQACDVPPEQLHKLIDYVYNRDKGSIPQELGGVALTLMVCCANNGEKIEEVAFRELRRVLDKDVVTFRKRNQNKLDEGFTA